MWTWSEKSQTLGMVISTGDGVVFFALDVCLPVEVSNDLESEEIVIPLPRGFETDFIHIFLNDVLRSGTETGDVNMGWTDCKDDKFKSFIFEKCPLYITGPKWRPESREMSKFITLSLFIKWGIWQKCCKALELIGAKRELLVVCFKE